MLYTLPIGDSKREKGVDIDDAAQSGKMCQRQACGNSAPRPMLATN